MFIEYKDFEKDEEIKLFKQIIKIVEDTSDWM